MNVARATCLRPRPPVRRARPRVDRRRLLGPRALVDHLRPLRQPHARPARRKLGHRPPGAAGRAAIEPWLYLARRSIGIDRPASAVQSDRPVGHRTHHHQADGDVYAISERADYSPWAEPPPLRADGGGDYDDANGGSGGSCAREGCRVGKGDYYYNLGFVTLTLDGDAAHAEYWEIEAETKTTLLPVATTYSEASRYFEETF